VLASFADSGIDFCFFISLHLSWNLFSLESLLLDLLISEIENLLALKFQLEQEVIS
jgi:hypothetical protein